MSLRTRSSEVGFYNLLCILHDVDEASLLRASRDTSDLRKDGDGQRQKTDEDGGLENGTAKADTLSWDRHKRWCEFYNTPATRTTASFLEKPSPHVKAGSHVNGISNI